MVSPCLNSDRVGTWLAGEPTRRHLPAFRSQPRPALFIGNCPEKFASNLTVCRTYQPVYGKDPTTSGGNFTDFQL
jgi:hypothetical protein